MVVIGQQHPAADVVLSFGVALHVLVAAEASALLCWKALPILCQITADVVTP